MRNFIQHHFNPMHVYCRLCRFMGRERARALARAYELTFYRRIFA